MRRFMMTTAMVVAAAVSSLPGAAAEPAPDPGWLQTNLDYLVRTLGVPGAQLVVSGDGGNTEIDSGIGDLGTGGAFPGNAQVRIASNTKTFVSTVLLQLVAEGLVDLDSPVEQYLPGLVRGPGGDGNRITVRNLLQHSSGIPDYFSYLSLESLADLQRPRSADELIRLALDQPAEFDPGTSTGYSNTGYLLAGKVIEQVTGRPVGLEVTRRILLPLGLHETYWPLFPLENTLRAPHPRAYHNFGGGLIDVADIDPGWGLSDGAMVSTGADLNRFFLALLSGRVLPPAQLAQMQHIVPSGDPLRGDDFGLGLFHRTNACGMEVWSHGGAMHGFLVLEAAAAGRAVTVSMNQLPDPVTTVMSQADMNAVIDAALCRN
ncbi:serine hydrolase domain-containing protein [Nocardia sp. NPDC049149]|uniref:serine hydrolase domain-containing protein n=1 Tax=Nocardia sp. NPDC049149 TaxID=3364315 RepID=UPI0037244C89